MTCFCERKSEQFTIIRFFKFKTKIMNDILINTLTQHGCTIQIDSHNVLHM